MPKTPGKILMYDMVKIDTIIITIRNENIKETNSIKFLGIIVDNKLKWHEHIIYIKNKVSRATGIIYKPENMPISKLSNKCITHLFFHISFIVVKSGETYRSTN